MTIHRFVAVGDTHGDKIDRRAEAAFFDFVKGYKPSIRIHVGDAFDFRWLRKSAGDAERWADVQADFDAGIDFIAKFRPTHLLWGNHDDRLRRLVEEGNGAMRALGAMWHEEIQDALASALGGQRCVQLPYCKRKGILRLGKLAFAHGYGHGIHTLRAHAMTYGNIIIGHIHSVAEADTNRHDGARGWSAGYLCDLDMDYTRASMGTLRQSHGWAYGTIDDATGDFTCRVNRLEPLPLPRESGMQWNFSDWSPRAVKEKASRSGNSWTPPGKANRLSSDGSKSQSKTETGNDGWASKPTIVGSNAASGGTVRSKGKRRA